MELKKYNIYSVKRAIKGPLKDVFDILRNPQARSSAK